MDEFEEQLIPMAIVVSSLVTNNSNDSITSITSITSNNSNNSNNDKPCKEKLVCLQSLHRSESAPNCL